MLKGSTARPQPLGHPEYRALVSNLTELLDEAVRARPDNDDVVAEIRDDAAGRPSASGSTRSRTPT